MRVLTAVCILAALGMGIPAGAQTPAGGEVNAGAAPVTISECRGGIASVELIEIATYDVTFRNTGSVPADEIRLSARYGRHQKHATFDVKGVFPPGGDVSRHLQRTVSGGLFAYRSDHNDCAVEYVHFSDGTTWTRPAPPRTPRSVPSQR